MRIDRFSVYKIRFINCSCFCFVLCSCVFVVGVSLIACNCTLCSFTWTFAYTTSLSFRKLCISNSPNDVTLYNSFSTCSPLSPPITHTFSLQAQNSHSLLAPTRLHLRALYTGLHTGPELSRSMVFVVLFPVFFVVKSWGIQSRFSRQLSSSWSRRKPPYFARLTLLVFFQNFKALLIGI